MASPALLGVLDDIAEAIAYFSLAFGAIAVVVIVILRRKS